MSGRPVVSVLIVFVFKYPEKVIPTSCAVDGKNICNKLIFDFIPFQIPKLHSFNATSFAPTAHLMKSIILIMYTSTNLSLYTFPKRWMYFIYLYCKLSNKLQLTISTFWWNKFLVQFYNLLLSLRFDNVFQMIQQIEES